jgi:NAD(P)-dependent dehydrogenase (short-subunit alcohol dehydrogenase family)
MRLTNKVAIVTGGASGMGEAAALGLAREGAKVAIADVNATNGEAVVARIRDTGGEAIFVKTDVTQATEVEAMVATAEATFGFLNVAFVSAAVQLVGKDARAHELPEDVFDRTLAINLKGMWLTCKYVLAAMLRHGSGSLIIAGSPTGLIGAGGYTAYATSKGGSFSLARTIARDYAADHIRANVIVPGPMRTPLTTEIFANAQFYKDTVAHTLMGRLGEADEIVPLLVFLASDESSYCTGGHYMADGGYTAF